jgi:hypothetical protein
LILPLAPGETGPRGLHGEPHYFVSVDAALAILERVSPEAVAWLRANPAGLIGPEQTFAFAASTCGKVIRLQVGNRELVIDAWPLPVGKVTFESKRLHRPAEHLLVLKPNLFQARFISLFLFFFGGLLFWASLDPANWIRHDRFDPFMVIASCASIVFLAIGVGIWVLPRRFKFDRAAGGMRVSWPESRRKRPLQEVLAVQLIADFRRTWEWGPTRRGIGVSLPDVGRARTTLQLNLVLQDDRHPRMNLMNHADRKATRAVAVKLAEFLRVPLVDEAGQMDDQAQVADRPAELMWKVKIHQGQQKKARRRAVYDILERNGISYQQRSQAATAFRNGQEGDVSVKDPAKARAIVADLQALGICGEAIEPIS